MPDDRQRLFFEMLHQTGEICEEILVLIAAACAWPFALAVPAEIQGDGVFYRQPSVEQRREERLPAPSLIADAVNEHIRIFPGITPFPIMQFQPVMREESFLRL